MRLTGLGQVTHLCHLALYLVRMAEQNPFRTAAGAVVTGVLAALVGGLLVVFIIALAWVLYLAGPPR